MFPPTLLVAQDRATGPLADYVKKEDASYRWQLRREGRVATAEYVELQLTSQTWRDITWKHQLFIIKPSSVGKDNRHALLFVAGGRWKHELEQPPGDEKLPKEANLLALVAEQMKTPVAILLQVPHQPIFDGKYEDEIIALTFAKFMESGDEEWPLLLPMVKSAVRGMDATEEFSKEKWSLDIDTFTVTGASKRGWTTWLTGAVDQRVTAIAPMVIDVLNMAPQMRHQQKAWGDVSYKIKDYSERGLTEHLESEAGKALRAIVDPYSYRKVLTQPKLIIIGTNDHYWPLDALNLYWEDLAGPKYILYVPNNRHGLNDYGRLTGSLNAVHQHAARKAELPDLSWKFSNGAKTLSLEIRSDLKPQKVDVWIATSKTRDFREVRWTPRTTRRDGERFLYALKLPERGYAAMFGEAVYDGSGVPYFLSTNVQIVGSPAEAGAD
jgi:PhoPQ-activated pathogenicity-related protein